ncbi:adenine deaminase [Geofilum rubicundum]|uniref:Adenine deaminase n=1 Tax=Geofilum rubicundum JCM 15548 TaxID=1236989 RepID=A0A0E9M2D4_9BACT|nr:adenine deaminase [Geofilum rubicundum]GAO31290.1 adenine deaminase [Geofilum rubicundum JCM 15548]
MKSYSIKGQIVDLHNKAIFGGEVYIEGEIIVRIEPKEVPDKRYILPGLVDAHVHIESSMVTPSRFAEMVVPRGTVAVVTDPHEIANVMGEAGVDYMIQDGARVPFKFFFGAPSCVPATPFESSGAIMDHKTVERLLERKDIWFLSEMMNFPGVISAVEDVVNKCAAARKLNKPIDGHAPGLKGDGLKKYAAQGIVTDHECAFLEEAEEKLALGMKIQIREGSAARNFSTLFPLFKKHPNQLMLCTDDSHPDEILQQGHIDRLVKMGIHEFGVDLFDLLRAATVVPVEHYQLPVGLLREGDAADFIVVDNFEDFNIQATYINGEQVYDQEQGLLFEVGDSEIVNAFRNEPIQVEDLKVFMPLQNSAVRVIEAQDGELLTESLLWEPALKPHREIGSQPDMDIIKLVVVNRYSNQAPMVGFVKNMGLRKGAIGGTVAHDSHNIIVAGVDDVSIAQLINALVDHKGGIAVCDASGVSILPLPVAGLMSIRRGEDVALEYLKLSDKAKELGSELKAPFMTLSFLSLLVIPSLKLGDKGLFDVNRFEFVSLFE